MASASPKTFSNAAVNERVDSLPRWVEAGIKRRQRRVVNADADLGRFRAGWQAYTDVYRDSGLSPSIYRPVLSIARDLAPYVLALTAVVLLLRSV